MGELVFAEGVLAWHEHPTPAACTQTSADGRRTSSRSGFAPRTSPGLPTRSRTSQLELDWCTAFQRAAVRGDALDPVRRDRDLRRDRGARGAPERRSARSGRSARRTASPRSCRATGWSAPTASARTARSGRSTSDGFWSSRVSSFSEDVRDASWPGSRPPASATGWPSCRRSSTSRDGCTCSAAARSAFTSISPALPLPAGRLRCCEGSASARRSGPTSGARSAGDALPAARRRRGAREVLERGGRRRCALPPARAAAAEGRLARVLPLGVRARRAARGGLGEPAAVGAPRGAQRVARGRGRVAAAAAAEGGELRVAERADHVVAYAKGIDRIAGVLAAAGASEAALALQERAVVGSTRARANRLANADHANLVRSAGRRTPSSRRCAASAQRPPRLACASAEGDRELRLKHPSLSLRELGAKCDPPASKSAAHRRLRSLERIARRRKRCFRITKRVVFRGCLE